MPTLKDVPVEVDDGIIKAQHVAIIVGIHDLDGPFEMRKIFRVCRVALQQTCMPPRGPPLQHSGIVSHKLLLRQRGSNSTEPSGPTYHMVPLPKFLDCLNLHLFTSLTGSMCFIASDQLYFILSGH